MKETMRKWVALALLCGFAWPAMAEKTMSVAQMERLLASLDGKPDKKVAAALDNVRLTERVSLARLARWEVEFPGSNSRGALMKLADLAIFLNPPAADLPRDPAPDTDTQKQILRMAEQNVKTMTARLPDFYATRVASHFEDNLSQVSDLWVGQGSAALHLTGSFSKKVTYRDGHEVPFQGTDESSNEPVSGLTCHGEFGPLLEQVFGDALESGVRFLRWERESGRATAVFGYAVPQTDSHFRVTIATGNQVASVASAYHGEIEIDPETGDILRVVEIADMTPPSQAKIEVEYAPVPIGPRSYILPVWGVAFSRIAVSTYIDQGTPPEQTMMNDMSFVHYHQFHSTARIVPDWSGKGTTPQPKNTAPASGPQPPAWTNSAVTSASAPALPPPAATASFAGPLIRTTTPLFSHQYLIEFQHAGLAPDGPNVLIWKSTGEFVDQFSVGPQGTTAILLTSADVGANGRLAVAGSAKRADGSVDDFIGTTDLAGLRSSYFDTGNYRASLIAVADDGSIWAIGSERGVESGGGVLKWHNYDMLRHFSTSGVLLEHFLPRWGPEVATRTLSRDANGEKQWQAYNAAGAAVSTTAEERHRGNAASWQSVRRAFLRSMGSVTVFYDGIEDRICKRDTRVATSFSCMRITGSTAAQFSVTTGFALSSSGTVYASLRSGDTEEYSDRGLFVLAPSADKQSFQWVPIAGEQASGLHLGDFVSLIGSDGPSLALRMVVPQGGDLVVNYVSAP